jgi:carbonic anhydrase
MSIFSSQTTWPPQCLSANQSPLNLSQTSSKVCNGTCELVMDDGYISQAVVSISDEGLLLTNTSGLGTCKFRSETYVCQALHINHPSHHTLEGVQADGEVTAIFQKPTGELLCVSSLFRVNPSQTPSYTFFKQFVPYALPSGDTQVKLQDWSLSMMIPSTSPFYVYSGSTLVPPCTPCEWVVFRTMINIDTGDFAYLIRNSEAGSRTITSQGNREVFFNDSENLSGSMPNDGKLYLRLKPLGNTPLPSSKKPVDFSEEKSSTLKSLKKGFKDHVDSNGGIIQTIEFWLVILLVCIGIKFGYDSSNKNPFTFQVFTDNNGLLPNVSGAAKTSVSYSYSILKWLYETTIRFFNFMWETIKFFLPFPALENPSSSPT